VREAADVKARRLLVEGRLIVRHVEGAEVRAVCRGDAALYRVSHTIEHGWTCDCPAVGRCSHLIAVGLVVVLEPTRAA
jgi:uncharacterized Zn finger protein